VNRARLNFKRHRCPYGLPGREVTDFLRKLPEDFEEFTFRPFTLAGYVHGEVERLPVNSRVKSALFHSVYPVARDALNVDPNPIVCARFAAEHALDCYWRDRIQAALAEQTPELWLEGAGRGWIPDSVGAQTTQVDGPLGPNALKELIKQPSPLPEAQSRHIVDEQYSERGARLTYHADNLRPPLRALQTVVYLLRPYLGKGKRILGLELGHSAAAQALSLWAPEATVYTQCRMLDPDDQLPVEVAPPDVVILNLPSLKATYMARQLLDTGGLEEGPSITSLLEQEIGSHRAHVEPLVSEAIGYVEPGGVLAVLGDVFPNVHHRASSLINDIDNFEPLITEDVNTVERPIWIRYPDRHRLWGPGGMLLPTDRLLSTWRRRS